MSVEIPSEARDAETCARPELPVHVFIARQPILGSNRRIYGYELLYRSSTRNAYDGGDGSAATTEVIANWLMTVGLAKLVGNGFAFVNFNRELLLGDVPTMLPARSVVVEILETVQMDDAVVSRCHELKRLGYQLALDDVSATELIRPLAPLADIIKVDFRQTSRAQQERIASDFRHSKARLVAEKVETADEYKRACQLGYSYFQGYYFERPAILTANRVSSQKSTYVQILNELTQSDLNYAQLERLFKHDPPLTYRLLRYLNSALFNWTSPIQSVRHALSLLGEAELRRWLGLLGLASLAEGKPNALIVAAVIRGRFCELLSARTRLASRSSEMFLMGLLSLFDTVLECPMEDVVSGLGLTADVRAALLGTADDSSRLYRVFKLVLAWENADWDTALALSELLDVEAGAVADLYAEAVTWSDHICDVASLDAAVGKA